MIPNRSVAAWKCGRYAFRFFAVDFSARVYGVAAGVSGLIDEAKHREYRGKCSRVYIFTLVFAGDKAVSGDRFGQHITQLNMFLTELCPILMLCGETKQGRSKQSLRASINAWIRRGDLC